MPGPPATQPAARPKKVDDDRLWPQGKPAHWGKPKLADIPGADGQPGVEYLGPTVADQMGVDTFFHIRNGTYTED